MSTLGWAGWAVAGWLVGALAVMYPDSRITRQEVPLLMAWPVTVPLFAALRQWRRWRYTCPRCGRFYGDAEHYRLHMIHRINCPYTPEGDAR